MIDLIFAAPALSHLTEQLRHENLESAAILLAVPVRTSEGWRLLVKEMHVPQDADYDYRTPVSVRLGGSFCLPIEKKARLQGLSLVYCHTHPREDGVPGFSAIDNRSEAALGPYASSRSPKAPHISILFGREQLIARRLGGDLAVRVFEVGEKLRLAYARATEQAPAATHDRQIRAFGREGQRILSSLKIGVVGLGGTGSAVVQQLAYLGVNKFLLIDPDVIEESNLNRLIGATPQDVGKCSKVDVAVRMIKTLQPQAMPIAIKGDVNDEPNAKLLLDVDFIFCCTDSHASRHLLNQLAYQYVIPAIDVGVAINRAADEAVQIAGRVTMLAPGLPCLWCAEQLDPNQVRQGLMTEEQRRADPYVLGFGGIVQPAVISINSTVSSLAITMFLSIVTDIPARGRYLIYDGNRSRVSSLSVATNSTCNFCSASSSAGQGNTFPLPVRRGA